MRRASHWCWGCKALGWLLLAACFHFRMRSPSSGTWMLLAASAKHSCTAWVKSSQALLTIAFDSAGVCVWGTVCRTRCRCCCVAPTCWLAQVSESCCCHCLWVYPGGRSHLWGFLMVPLSPSSFQFKQRLVFIHL